MLGEWFRRLFLRKEDPPQEQENTGGKKSGKWKKVVGWFGKKVKKPKVTCTVVDGKRCFKLASMIGLPDDVARAIFLLVDGNLRDYFDCGSHFLQYGRIPQVYHDEKPTMAESFIASFSQNQKPSGGGGGGGRNSTSGIPS